jgi:hypothetical protein
MAIGDAAWDMDMGDAERRGAGVYPPRPVLTRFLISPSSCLSVVGAAVVACLCEGACCCPMLTQPCESPFALLPPRSAMMVRRVHGEHHVLSHERSRRIVTTKNLCIPTRDLNFVSYSMLLVAITAISCQEKACNHTPPTVLGPKNQGPKIDDNVPAICFDQWVVKVQNSKQNLRVSVCLETNL